MGFLMCRPYELSEQRATLISWIWIASSAPKEVRAGVKGSVVAVLSEKMTSDYQIIAAVQALNARSLRFFTSLGFKPKWAAVRRP